MASPAAGSACQYYACLPPGVGAGKPIIFCGAIFTSAMSQSVRERTGLAGLAGAGPRAESHKSGRATRCGAAPCAGPAELPAPRRRLQQRPILSRTHVTPRLIPSELLRHRRRWDSAARRRRSSGRAQLARGRGWSNRVRGSVLLPRAERCHMQFGRQPASLLHSSQPRAACRSRVHCGCDCTALAIGVMIADWTAP